MKPNRQRRINIQIWLLKKGIRQRQIHRETGASTTSVSHTISGRRNDKRVTEWLLEHGCPAEYLELSSGQQLTIHPLVNS